MIAVLAILASGVSGIPAEATSRAELDVACAESQEAYDAYRAARSDFESGCHSLETAHLELADAEYQEERIRDVYQDRQNKSSSAPRSSLRPLSSTCRPLPALP